MANSIKYGDILTKVLKEESKTKLFLKSLNLSADGLYKWFVRR